MCRSVTERSTMDDNRIIELLFERAETALDEVFHKYSGLYKGIIREVLSDERDVDECSNDVLLAVWNSVPPNKPKSLPAYICKIARRIGIDRLRYNTRQKRNTGYTVILSELEDCLPEEAMSDHSLNNVNIGINGKNCHNGERNEIIRAVLSDFVRKLDPETQVLFIRRYVYLETVKGLAERFGMDENYVSVKLYRVRKKLKKVFEKEGVRV